MFMREIASVKSAVEEMRGLKALQEQHKKDMAALQLKYDALQERLQRLETPPPMPPRQPLTPLDVRRRIFEDPQTTPPTAAVSPALGPASAEVAVDNPQTTPPRAAVSPALGPASPEMPPYIRLRVVTAERDAQLYAQSRSPVTGEYRPDVYAASLLRALVPHEQYAQWGKKVNWSGSKKKKPLPENLKQEIQRRVQERFTGLSPRDWSDIRGKINERLRSPRKTDPELRRVGFGVNA